MNLVTLILNDPSHVCISRVSSYISEGYCPDRILTFHYSKKLTVGCGVWLLITFWCSTTEGTLVDKKLSFRCDSEVADYCRVWGKNVERVYLTIYNCWRDIFSTNDTSFLNQWNWWKQTHLYLRYIMQYFRWSTSIIFKRTLR